MGVLGCTVLVGCGGTGSYLAEPLARLLAFAGERGPLYLVDGDRYEAGNASRQVFASSALGRNKAEFTEARLKAYVPGCSPVAVPGYLDERSLAELVSPFRDEPGTVLLLPCVDNHATRLQSLLAADGLPNVAWASPGNDLAHGSVVTFRRVDGQTVGLDPRLAHPELAEPSDRPPGGCLEQAPSTPQLIGANLGAATVTLWLVQALLAGMDWPAEVVFDSFRLRVREA